MRIDMKAACKLLHEHDNILIFAHQKPDGDTFGASFALMWALKSLGKRAQVLCSDGFPERYNFIYEDYAPEPSFLAEYFVTVDVASAQLLGEFEASYGERIDLCIDHHKSNTMFAKNTLLDAEAPAASQVVYELIASLGAPFDRRMANAIFTGLSTDTGCFKYSNVTAKTHRVAADMIDNGAQHAMINKLMFDTKSRGRIAVERLMMETMRFYFNDRCALVVLPEGITDAYSVTEEELDGIAAFSVRIEGVYAGITVRTRPDSTYRVSVRSVSPVDAAYICGQFGGGGHMNAAGCTLSGEIAEIESQLLGAVEKELEQKMP